jgi:hypothetical protein
VRHNHGGIAHHQGEHRHRSNLSRCLAAPRQPSHMPAGPQLLLLAWLTAGSSSSRVCLATPNSILPTQHTISLPPPAGPNLEPNTKPWNLGSCHPPSDPDSLLPALPAALNPGNPPSGPDSLLPALPAACLLMMSAALLGAERA